MSDVQNHLAKKLDRASYLVGFAHSIIEMQSAGTPAGSETIAKFKREYNEHFKGSNPDHLIAGST